MDPRVSFPRADDGPNLVDHQLIQIVIDETTNGGEFEFADIILTTDIILKGYSLYSDLGSTAGGIPLDDLFLVPDPNLPTPDDLLYANTRGHLYVQIEWLKCISVESKTERNNMIAIPWDYTKGLSYITQNLAMDLRFTLPSATSMRKRFKATVLYQDTANSTAAVKVYKPMPLRTVAPDKFKLFLYFEAKHDHIFR